MPCPTVTELVAMASRLAVGSSVDEFSEIVQRTRERTAQVGPFTRIIFELDESQYSIALTATEEMRMKISIEWLKWDPNMDNPERSSSLTVSHRLFRYTTPNSRKGDFTYYQIVPATELVVQDLRRKARDLSEEQCREILLRAMKNEQISWRQWGVLEQLLSEFYSRDLRWCWIRCHSSEEIMKENEAGESGGRSTRLKVSKVEDDVFVKLKSMRPGILYRPREENFPFVDMIWVEEMGGASVEEESGGSGPSRTFYAIQCTMSKTHAKPTSSLALLGKRLGEEKGDFLLVVYIATMPDLVEEYRNGTLSVFCKGVSTDPELEKARKRVEFRVLITPPDLKNREFVPDREFAGIANLKFCFSLVFPFSGAAVFNFMIIGCFFLVHRSWRSALAAQKRALPELWPTRPLMRL